MTNLIEEIGGVIVSPQETMEKISEKDELKGAFIIVLLTGILGGINTIVIYYSVIYYAMMPEIPPILWIVGFTIANILLWILFAGIYRIIALILGGKGTYSKVLQLYGYAFVPALLVFPLSTITFLLAGPMISTIVDLIGAVWYIIMYTIAISVAERISTIKALIVVLTPIILLVVIVMILVALVLAPLMPATV